MRAGVTSIAHDDARNAVSTSLERLQPFTSVMRGRNTPMQNTNPSYCTAGAPGPLSSLIIIHMAKTDDEPREASLEARCPAPAPSDAFEDDLNRAIAQDKRGAHAPSAARHAPRRSAPGGHASAGAIAISCTSKKDSQQQQRPATKLGETPLCTVCSRPPSPDSEKVC